MLVLTQAPFAYVARAYHEGEFRPVEEIIRDATPDWSEPGKRPYITLGEERGARIAYRRDFQLASSFYPATAVLYGTDGEGWGILHKAAKALGGQVREVYLEGRPALLWSPPDDHPLRWGLDSAKRKLARAFTEEDIADTGRSIVIYCDKIREGGESCVRPNPKRM